MTSSKRLEQELLAASNEALIQRAVKGSFLYVILAFLLLLATDWRTDHLGIGVCFLGLITGTAAVRFVYLRWVLKHPEVYTHGSPRGLAVALISTPFAFGCQAAAAHTLFGIASVTSALTLMLVFGLAAAGTSSLAMNRRIHTLFLLSLLVPLVISTLATGTSTGAASAVFVVLYIVFLHREGVSANAAFIQLISGGFELKQAFSALKIKQAELVEAHDSNQLVMDNVEQGLCIVDTKGVIECRGSKSFEAWFGVVVPGTTLGCQISDACFAEWFELSIEMLDEDILPAEVVIDQLPTLLVQGERQLAFSYRPIDRLGKTVGLLVVVNDITERMAIQKAESEQRELAQLFQLLARDPDGFTEFRISAQSLVSTVTEPSPRIEQLRALHTLKGNTGLVGIASLADLCHELEDELVDGTGPIEEEQAERLTAAWSKTESLMGRILGERENVIELSEAEHGQLLAMLNAGAPHRLLSALVNDWRLESVPRRFERLALQAERVGRSLGKVVRVHLDVPPLRLDNERWRDFWMACTHLLRNAVDHGIEDRETRIANDKPENGTVRLSAYAGEGEIVVRLGDDGRGIDWSKVASQAELGGLPYDTFEALQDALFADGISTREKVTAISGRGIGLGAVAQETHRMGGTIEVRSTIGVGTEFVIRLPRRHSQAVAAVQTEGAA